MFDPLIIQALLMGLATLLMMLIGLKLSKAGTPRFLQSVGWH